jgi:DTW domain-containing protein YfiP
MIRCPGCRLAPALCYCRELESVPCGIRVIVVRHAGEERKSSGTGQLLARVVGATLLPYGKREVRFDPAKLPAQKGWLLFPEGPHQRPSCARPLETLVVLDGTWPQARRMRQRIPALLGLQLLALPAPAAPVQRLRAAVQPHELPTALAAAGALELCGEERAAAALRRAFSLMVERCRAPGRH